MKEEEEFPATVEMDDQGRVTIPLAVRRTLRLEKGAILELRIKKRGPKT